MACEGRTISSAPMSSSSWVRLVALAIGAVTVGRAINQASATWGALRELGGDANRGRLIYATIPRLHSAPPLGACPPFEIGLRTVFPRPGTPRESRKRDHADLLLGAKHA